MNLKNKKTIDDQLADYTDNILNEKTTEADENPSTLDPELRALEQTALRLKSTFRDEGPSEEVIRRMRRNIITQWEQQENKRPEPFWKKWMPAGQKWQSQRSRRRIRVAISLGTLLVILFTGVYLLHGTGTEQFATSGQNLNVSIVFIVGSLVLLAVWINLRKR